jgi:hypothetical protein
MRGLAHFTHSARLTAKPAPDGFFLAGEGKFGEKKEDGRLPGYVPRAVAQGFRPFHLVPTRTATFRRWAFGDAPQWTRRLAGYWAQHEPQTPVLRQALAKQYGIGLDGFSTGWATNWCC